MIKVVAALIENNNKFLIVQRATGDSNVLGKWEFPGGKVQKGETEKNAVEREINEELELKIKVKEFIANNIYKYPNKIIDLRLYKCEYISGDIKLHDHFQYKWINKNEFLTYDLAPADIPLAKLLVGVDNNE